MLRFLDEESIKIHKEYTEDLRLKYSILEKSIDGIKGKSPRELLRMHLHKRDRDVTVELLSEIRLHTLFFSSFTDEENQASHSVRAQYGSEAALLNLLYKEGVGASRGGFLCLYRINNQISYSHALDYKMLFLKSEPLLAIDLCEHAYFFDYGFRKGDYLINALKHLKLSVFDNL